jgi:hypothetical protein
MTVNVKVCEHFQYAIFKPPHVSMQAKLEKVEIENWVDNELTWPVVRDVATAISLVHLDSRLPQHVWRAEQMGGGSCAAGDGDDWRRMLDE